MKKKILLIASLFFLLPFTIHAQNTNVSATVTDSGSVLWANGTFTFNFIPNPRFQNGPYFNNGAPFTPASISGSLSGTGTYTQAVPSNSTITPSGTQWTVTYCPQATAPCQTSSPITITGASQTITSNFTPSALTVAPGSQNLVYNTNEVPVASLGSQVYLIGTGLQICNAVTGTSCTTWASSGGSSSPVPALFQRIQTKAYVNVTSTPATNAYTSNVGMGHLLVAVVTVFSGTASAPTDTLGTVFTQAGSTTGAAANDYLFYGRTTNSGADTVSMAFTGTRAYLSVAEYSGQATFGIVVDTVSNLTLTGTAVTAPLYVGNAGELLVTLFQNSTQTETYSNFGGGLTLQSSIAGGGNAAWGDNLSSALGLNVGSATMSISDTWIGKTWAFLPANLPIPATLSFVRSTETVVKDVGAPPTSPATVAFQTGNNPGNTILLFETQYFGTFDNTSSITDSVGDKFVRIAQGSLNNSGGTACWGVIYAAQNISGSLTSNTITVNFTGLTDAMEIFAVEIQDGLAVDTQLSATAASGATVTGNISLANPNEVIYVLSSSITTGAITATGSNLTNYGSTGAGDEVIVNVIPAPTKGTNNISMSVAGVNGINLLAVGLIQSPIDPSLLPTVAQSNLFIANQGNPCTIGELALSAGWQSTGTATVTAVAGTGQTCSWTITTGTTTAANPTVTDTLTNLLPSASVCDMDIHGGTHTPAAGEGFTQTTVSATAPVFTFIGTPTAGNTTYFVTRRCGP